MNVEPAPASLVLSHIQATPLLAARAAGKSAAESSPDLGRSRVDVTLDATGVTFPDAYVVPWPALELIAAEETKCFALERGEPRQIEVFSDWSERVYTLYPTDQAPTMLISGIPMHRIKGTEPWADTLAKIKAAAPAGRVLDTTTGLGYTAIAAARTAEHVTTIELDPAVLELCRQNPWSRELFDDSKIEQRVGDSFEVVPTLPAATFSRVIHDPPMFSLAGELYSGAFYRELHRVLKPSGRLFHYIGNPESKSGGSVTKGVVRRLLEAGFRRVAPAPQAFGVVAYK